MQHTTIHGALLAALLCPAPAATAQDLFAPWPDIVLEHNGPIDVLPMDYDGDGDVDLITFFGLVYSPNAANEAIKFFRNDGGRPPQFTDDTPRVMGAFYAESQIEPGRFSSTYRFRFVDYLVGGRRKPMFVTARRKSDVLYDWDPVAARITGVRELPDQLNDWDDLCAGKLKSTRWTVGLATGDVDGDGHDDLVYGYRDSFPRLYLYDPATHGFRTTPPIEPPPEDLDYPAGSGQKYVFYGNGVRSTILADLDRDGVLDLIVLRNRASTFNWTNPVKCSTIVYQGHNPPLQRPLRYFTYAYELKPKLGEEDALNIVGTMCDGPDALRKNPDAQGSPSMDAAVVDLDRDGWPDLVLAIGGGPTEPGRYVDVRPRVYFNNGAGILGRTTPFRPDVLLGDFTADRTIISSAITAADLDNDGWLDLSIPYHMTNDPNVGDRLWMNDIGRPGGPTQPFSRLTWQGQPLEVRPQRLGQDRTRHCRFADLDGDGDLDMIEVNFQFLLPSGAYPAEDPRIFLNRLR